MDGLHEMIMNMIIAVIMDPKDSLNNNVALAFLGTTTKKLKNKCDWNQKTYESAVSTWKNRQGPFGASDSFVRKFYDPKDKEFGPYLRMIVADLAILVIDSVAFEGQIDSPVLDVAHKLFNQNDAVVALVASELADLHTSDKGMDCFDAFTVTSLRKQLLQ